MQQVSNYEFGAACFIRITLARRAFLFQIGFQMCKYAHLLCLDKSFLDLVFEADPYSDEYLVFTCKIGVVTAENDPSKVSDFIHSQAF